MSVFDSRKSVGVWQHYEPVPWARAFHRSRKFVTVNVGGLGSAKSYSCAAKMVAIAAAQNGNRVYCARLHEERIRKTFVPTLKEFLRYGAEDGFWKALVKKYSKTTDEISIRTVDGGEGLIFFGGAADPQTIRSLNVTHVFLEEVNEISEEVFLMVLARARMGSSRWNGVTCAMNPPLKTHWTYRYFVQDEATGAPLLGADTVDVFYSKTWDNPHLPPATVRAMDQAYRGEMRKRMIEGEFGTAVGGSPVFREFDPPRHVFHLEPELRARFLGGWDFGYNFPFALWGFQQPAGNIHVAGGLAGRTITTGAFAKQVQGHRRSFGLFADQFQDYGDPAGMQHHGASTDYQEVEQATGIRITPAPRGPGSVEAGLNVIREKLSQYVGGVPALSFGPGVPYVLLEALGGALVYQETPAPSGKTDPKVDKTTGHDHGVDALRYLLTGHLGLSGRRDSGQKAQKAWEDISQRKVLRW